MTIKLQYDDALMISILLTVTLIFFMYYQLVILNIEIILPSLSIYIMTLTKNIKFLFFIKYKNKRYYKYIKKRYFSDLLILLFKYFLSLKLLLKISRKNNFFVT